MQIWINKSYFLHFVLLIMIHTNITNSNSSLPVYWTLSRQGWITRIRFSNWFKKGSLSRIWALLQQEDHHTQGIVWQCSKPSATYYPILYKIQRLCSCCAAQHHILQTDHKVISSFKKLYLKQTLNVIFDAVYNTLWLLEVFTLSRVLPPIFKIQE